MKRSVIGVEILWNHRKGVERLKCVPYRLVLSSYLGVVKEQEVGAKGHLNTGFRGLDIYVVPHHQLQPWTYYVFRMSIVSATGILSVRTPTEKCQDANN